LYNVLDGPYAAGASRQGKPLRMTNMIPTDHAPIIDAWHPVGQREEPLDPTNLGFR
jgi:hypothetical protein